MNSVKIQKSFSDVSKQIWSKYSTIFVFIIIFVACSLLTNGKFSTWNNVTTILRNASTVGIIALGMTFVIISGGIDLSSGPVMATAGTVLVYMQKSGIPLAIDILVCIAVWPKLIRSYIINFRLVDAFISDTCISEIRIEYNFYSTIMCDVMRHKS